jgi:hypothetical protein
MPLSQQREHISLQESQFKRPEFSCPRIMLEGSIRRATPSARKVKEHKEAGDAAYVAQSLSESAHLLGREAANSRTMLFMGQPQTTSSSSSSSVSSQASDTALTTNNNSGTTSSVVHRIIGHKAA